MTTRSSNKSDAKIVIDTLIDGLGVTHPQLNERCARALRALGGRVIPLLSDVADDSSIRDTHRQRLRLTIESINDFQPIDDQIEVLIMDALLEVFRVDSPQLNSKAIAALMCLDPPPIDRLVLAAVSSRNQRGHCLRLLRAAGELGATPGVFRYFDLFSLLNHKHAAVRDEVCRLLSRLKPAGRVSARGEA